MTLELPTRAAAAPRVHLRTDTAPSTPAPAASGAPPRPGPPGDAAFDPVPAPLRAAMVARGFVELTDVQNAVLGAEIAGRDLRISSQTGSGKTVALGFVLAPGLAEPRSGDGPEALVVVPTRELAAQVREELGWLLADLPDARVAAVTGGTPVYRDRPVLARRPRVLVGTPGRLLDHLTSGALDLGGVRQLVLDEADQMLDLGFRDELEGLLEGTPATRRTHLVSATFPEEIRRLAERYQRDPVAIEGSVPGDAHEDIEHAVHVVRPEDRYAALVNLLLLEDGGRVLVFVERRADALEVAERLAADGFAAQPLSGELVQSQRERTLGAFRAGRVRVLVATDVAARGLDVQDVAAVIQTTPPMDAQIYTHRSGRTGRAGKRGRSVLLLPPRARHKVTRMLREAGVEARWTPAPDAAAVRSALEERARAALAAEVTGALATGADDARRAQARELLAGREPEDVVAALLARLEPAPRARPRELGAPPADAREAPSGPRGERGPRTGGSRLPGGAPGGPNGRGPSRNDHGPGGGPGRGPRRRGFDGADAVRFFVNWGENQGATPGRVLAAVCRRGRVTGEHVGSIAIHPNASTFDVRADVAASFEELAGRRDPRDPRTWIRRDRGPRERCPDAR